jgi:hypothetical protein
MANLGAIGKHKVTAAASQAVYTGDGNVYNSHVSSKYKGELTWRVPQRSSAALGGAGVVGAGISLFRPTL